MSSSGAPASWTPADLTGLAFDFDPGDASTLTLVTTEIDAATDAQGGALTLAAPTSGRRPTVESATPLDGFNGANFASNDALETATGGVTAAAAFSMLYLGNITQATLGSLARMGPPRADFTAAKNATLGGKFADVSTQWWSAGAGDGGNGYGTYDTTVRSHIATYDGTTKRLYVDGEEAYSFAVTYDIASAGFGLGPWHDSFPGTGRVYRGMWGTAKWTRAEINELSLYLATTYPTVARRPKVSFDGDSLTSGLGLGAGDDYPSQCVALVNGGACDKFNGGTPSETVGDMNSNAATTIDLRQTWQRRVNNRNASCAVLWAGTNDLHFGASAATTLTRIETWIAARVAAGWENIFVVDMIKRAGEPGSFETDRATINAALPALCATYGAVLCPIGALAAFSDTSNLTYYQADGVHLAVGGAAVVAGVVADLIDARLGT